jgi:hypothetical protein
MFETAAGAALFRVVGSPATIRSNGLVAFAPLTTGRSVQKSSMRFGERRIQPTSPITGSSTERPPDWTHALIARGHEPGSEITYVARAENISTNETLTTTNAVLGFVVIRDQPGRAGERDHDAPAPEPGHAAARTSPTGARSTWQGVGVPHPGELPVAAEPLRPTACPSTARGWRCRNSPESLHRMPQADRSKREGALQRGPGLCLGRRQPKPWSVISPLSTAITSTGYGRAGPTMQRSRARYRWVLDRRRCRGLGSLRRFETRPERGTERRVLGRRQGAE